MPKKIYISPCQIVNSIFMLIFSLLFLSFALPTDTRVKSYALVDNPLPTIALVLVYLSWVLIIGPFYMRDKKPYSLRNTLIYYNAFQVLLSAYMFCEVGKIFVLLPNIYNKPDVQSRQLNFSVSLSFSAFNGGMDERIQLHMPNS